MTLRPTVQPRLYAWKDKAGNETPGIGLWGRRILAAHLTDTEARSLADKLHDLADDLLNLENRMQDLENNTTLYTEGRA